MTRRFALLAGAVAVVGMGGLSGCGNTTKEAPSTTNTPNSSAPAPSPNNPPSGVPIEKGMSPNAPNSFSPPVKAKPAPTATPG